ncbi:MAG: hypothetical protein LBH93_02345 [Chitinispirillales bacterium]|nr:hypothetical protein [Chitinispirillales bacterium]
MGIKAAVLRVGVVLAVAVTVASGEANPGGSVKIGMLTWTKKNINIETTGSWCYNDSASYCAKYGRLYTWEAAKKACNSMGGRWRLPMNEEWDDLVFLAGGEEVAGKKLKSTSGWSNNKDGASGNGTDYYEFSALPGGLRFSDDSSYGVGGRGSWWSASEYGAESAYLWKMTYDYFGVYLLHSDKYSGYSVRCVAGSIDLH